MSKHDRAFFDRVMIIIGIAVIVAGLLIVFSNVFQEKTQEAWVEEDPDSQAALEERIRPVGSVAVEGESPDEPVSVPDPDPRPEPETGPAVADIDGQAVYQNACVACHATGAGGAPLLGDAAAWADRMAQGRDVLVDHAINGFTGSTGIMLPKGGRADLSDEEVAAAVDHMIAESE